MITWHYIFFDNDWNYCPQVSLEGRWLVCSVHFRCINQAIHWVKMAPWQWRWKLKLFHFQRSFEAHHVRPDSCLWQAMFIGAQILCEDLIPGLFQSLLQAQVAGPEAFLFAPGRNIFQQPNFWPLGNDVVTRLWHDLCPAITPTFPFPCRGEWLAWWASNVHVTCRAVFIVSCQDVLPYNDQWLTLTLWFSFIFSKSIHNYRFAILTYYLFSHNYFSIYHIKSIVRKKGYKLETTPKHKLSS